MTEIIEKPTERKFTSLSFEQTQKVIDPRGHNIYIQERCTPLNMQWNKDKTKTSWNEPLQLNSLVIRDLQMKTQFTISGHELCEMTSNQGP